MQSTDHQEMLKDSLYPLQRTTLVQIGQHAMVGQLLSSLPLSLHLTMC